MKAVTKNRTTYTNEVYELTDFLSGKFTEGLESEKPRLIEKITGTKPTYCDLCSRINLKRSDGM
jgi:hypothetical protein